jgi:hypothetical protein
MDLNEFRKRLHAELVSYFTLPELTSLAQFELNATLSNVVFVQTAFGNVAFEFIGWCHREGKLGDLVKAAARCKPEIVVFQTLCREFDNLLAGAAPTAQDFRTFAGRFSVLLRYLEFLQAYKKLHDILHDLDGEIETFQHEADARGTAGVPISTGAADYLQGKVAEALEWRAKTEHPAKQHWVERFSKTVEEFLGPDPTKHDRALRRLKNLPAQELELLNSQLTDSAHRVDLEELGELLDWRLDGLPELAKAVSDFRRACVRVRDLTAAHDICQFIDREFRAAPEGISTSTDLDNWDDIRNGIEQVGVLRPNELNTTRVVTACTSFAAGGAAAETLFHNLRAKFAKLFELVDKELLDAIQPLLSSAFRLSTSLENPR